MTYGLDLGTEIESFWSWLNEAEELVKGTGKASKQIRDLVEGQRDLIDAMASAQSNPESAKFCLTVAVALVGFHYASHQKLLNGLKQLGVLDGGRAPIFDTIAGPPFEETIPW
jgi:hypothetical protein